LFSGLSRRRVDRDDAKPDDLPEHDIHIGSNEVGSERTENCFWHLADIPDISAFALLDGLRIGTGAEWLGRQWPRADISRNDLFPDAAFARQGHAQPTCGFRGSRP
jgi:hypothetical protein